MRKSILIPALVATAIPLTWALAQGVPPSTPGDAARGPGAGMPRPSPEIMNRMQEGRIAMIKAALKLTDAQQKLWGPVEEQMRAGFAERQATHEERRKFREERRAAREAGKLPDMAENLSKASEVMSKRAERLKAFAAAYKPFHESLSDEQKQVAGMLMRHVADGPGFGPGRGGHHGRWGHRWAMHGDGPKAGPMHGPMNGPMGPGPGGSDPR